MFLTLRHLPMLISCRRQHGTMFHSPACLFVGSKSWYHVDNMLAPCFQHRIRTMLVPFRCQTCPKRTVLVTTWLQYATNMKMFSSVGLKTWGNLLLRMSRGYNFCNRKHGIIAYIYPTQPLLRMENRTSAKFYRWVAGRIANPPRTCIGTHDKY